ncbi:hypothetical protein SAMIE_1015100 [Sphingobium amiense]|uniref:DUF922 domain-containing protein n=1 Tax=Sphingobium amiense TaxID=135719 RepID=A0A494WCI5_9SPHN|nr:hypothetical protein [Sphingobium amiense]BBD98009.1 hypothetical protein SAMIE_1015100 [Sphingobium amiense]
MSLILATLAAAASHSVALEHHGRQLGATYTARADVETRTVGARAGARMDSQRCRWTANIVVDRSLDHGPAHARTLPTDMRFSGSEPGACRPGRDPGAAVLARHGDAIRANLAALAQADRAPLLAELDSARALAVN